MKSSRGVGVGDSQPISWVKSSRRGGRGRGKPTKRRESELQDNQSKQELALKMLENQRKGLSNNMARGILESKAEKTKSIKEKLDRDRERVAVTPCKQPPREAAAVADYEDYCNTDSEDCNSDISTDSLGFEV